MEVCIFSPNNEHEVSVKRYNEKGVDRRRIAVVFDALQFPVRIFSTTIIHKELLYNNPYARGCGMGDTFIVDCIIYIAFMLVMLTSVNKLFKFILICPHIYTVGIATPGKRDIYLAMGPHTPRKQYVALAR